MGRLVLGALEMARRNPDIDKALGLTQSAVEYNQIALVLNPENDAWRRDMARFSANWEGRPMVAEIMQQAVDSARAPQDARTCPE